MTKRKPKLSEVPPNWSEPKVGPEIMLRSKTGDLDGYIFVDEAHAREWLSQGFVTEEWYSVELVTTQRTPCCHKLIKAKTLKALTVSEFLKSKER